MASVAWADSVPRHRRRVGALLDQLEVVVAELPEELLGDLERGRVVVGVERLGGLPDDALEPASTAQSTVR
jgi:hypothetical protein